jgi:hypothetical protein
MNESITNKLDSMPELLSSHDLVTLGLYRSTTAAYMVRLRGHSPDFIKVGGLVKYPKAKIVEFISSRIQNGSTPSINSNK